MTNTDAYNLLDDLWHTLDAGMDDLITACTTKQQAQALVQAWEQANTNAMAARNKIFTTDDAALADLSTRIQTADTSIQASLADLESTAADIGRFTALIQTISQAVALGSQMITAIAAL